MKPVDSLDAILCAPQIRFIACAILPTFSLLESLLPDAHVALQHAKDNIHQWERRRDAIASTSHPTTSSASQDVRSRAWALGSISRHPGAFWQNLLLLAQYFVWLSSVVGATLVDCMLLDDLTGPFSPKSRASVVVPVFFLLVAVLRSVFSELWA